MVKWVWHSNQSRLFSLSLVAYHRFLLVRRVRHQAMAFRVVRSSKVRHVFGRAHKRDQCYDGISVTRNAHDSDFCSANNKFLAVVIESVGGGAFIVHPLDKVKSVTTSKRRGVDRTADWRKFCRMKWVLRICGRCQIDLGSVGFLGFAGLGSRISEEIWACRVARGRGRSDLPWCPDCR